MYSIKDLIEKLQCPQRSGFCTLMCMMHVFRLGKNGITVFNPISTSITMWSKQTFCVFLEV